MLKSLWNDENGVIISAELVLIGTILVLGMIVGLVELRTAVVGELGDLGDAFGNLDQSYVIPGIKSCKDDCSIKAMTAGSRFTDTVDECDCNTIIVCDAAISDGEQADHRGSYSSGIDDHDRHEHRHDHRHFDRGPQPEQRRRQGR